MTLTHLLILMHAVSGGSALLAGLGAMTFRKGGLLHKKSGTLFYYSLLISASLACVISRIPGHMSLFLFAIGIFTLYLILTGRRAIRKQETQWPDYAISITMLITGVVMIAMAFSKSVQVVLLVFGSIGVFLSVRDLLLYRNQKKYQKQRIFIHIGNMTGGMIAASTAFLVVNQWVPGMWGWFSPTIAGLIFMVWHMRKRQNQS